MIHLVRHAVPGRARQMQRVVVLAPSSQHPMLSVAAYVVRQAVGDCNLTLGHRIPSLHRHPRRVLLRMQRAMRWLIVVRAAQATMKTHYCIPMARFPRFVV
jgi:hypothetical protein